jgi:hypothetical protein
LNTINDYCYWFYDAQKYWHRFDSSVVVKSNLVQAQKTIAQLYSIEQEKNVALSEAPNKIYMTLFTIKGSFDEKTAVLDQVRIYELIFRD